MLRHVIDEEVVSDLGISINPLAVSLSNSLSKYSGVFRIKKKIDSSELAILFSAIPITSIKLPLFIICVNQNSAPFSFAIWELEKAFAWNRGEVTLLIITKRDPFLRKTAIIFSIVKRL